MSTLRYKATFSKEKMPYYIENMFLSNQHQSENYLANLNFKD
jgi:hypothetical protein